MSGATSGDTGPEPSQLLDEPLDEELLNAELDELLILLLELLELFDDELLLPSDELLLDTGLIDELLLVWLELLDRGSCEELLLDSGLVDELLLGIAYFLRSRLNHLRTAGGYFTAGWGWATAKTEISVVIFRCTFTALQTQPIRQRRE